MSKDMRAERLDYIDGLKGLLSLAIVCYHYYTNFCDKDAALIPIPITALFTQGYLAVEMFFMLSGFLTASKYFGRSFTRTLHLYLLGKAQRIMPCFFISNILIVIASVADHYVFKTSLMPSINLWKFVLSCMPFNYGWVGVDAPYSSVGWFISVLFLCYIIYFYIMKSNENFKTEIPLCMVMVFMGWSLYQLNLQIPFLYRQSARGYICFFMGVLLNRLFDQKFNKKLLSEIGLILIAVLALASHKHGFDRVFGNVMYSFSFIVFPILLLAVTSLNVFQKILSIPLVVYLGRASLSIYLIHHPVMRIIKMVDLYREGV